MVQQPYLHDLHAAVAAPVQAWFGPDGQVRGTGAQGWYVTDTRAVAGAVVTVGGHEPTPIGVRPDGPGRLVASFVARDVDTPDADPTVRLDRHVTVTTDQVHERFELTCATPGPVTTRLELVLDADATEMDAVRTGAPSATPPPVADDASWPLYPGLVARTTTPGATVIVGAGQVTVGWDVTVVPGQPTVREVSVALADPTGVVHAPATAGPGWSRPEVAAADGRLTAWLDRALDDLASLRMTAQIAPDDVFLAAGAPWFFTLFGRDSLWAARMLLPLGTDLAAGTLRTLAAGQGTKVDPDAAEEPGKILHEVRRTPLAVSDDGTWLPPLYYGTVDATALWVCVLHDAWRWGMDPGEVAGLMDPLTAALTWITDCSDPDGDGFCEYVDTSGHGLANQGWKDSEDSVRWRDGRQATPPIALVEVQGYAHEAATKGADLLDAFGRPGADRLRAWAARLAERFRAAFWVDDPAGRYPGVALDGDKRLVDSVASNMGHLLGTGLLDAAEERLVADRLAAPDMTTATGLRTLAAGSGGYWPLRYHCGTVWPHDTAIALAGLAGAGHTAPAAALARGLLAGAATFRMRVPELWSGEDRPDAAPYPAACRPQAWSAAAAVVVLSSCLGLSPDVPNRRLTLRGNPSLLGPLRVRNLRLAGRRLDVEVTDTGTVVTTDADVEIVGP